MEPANSHDKNGEGAQPFTEAEKTLARHVLHRFSQIDDWAATEHRDFRDQSARTATALLESRVSVKFLK
jgi:hypothetical protein